MTTPTATATRRVTPNPDATLTWRCQTCGKPIRDRTGYVHLPDRALRAAQAADRESRERVAAYEAEHALPGGLCAVPLSVYGHVPLATWEAHHRKCDPDPDGVDYWFAVERTRTQAQLLNWAAHLLSKRWNRLTDFPNLLREASGRNA